MHDPNLFDIFIELLKNMTESTVAGTIGVSLIFIYFFWILFTALRRIHETLQEDHNHH